jgi:hypothetical protein
MIETGWFVSGGLFILLVFVVSFTEGRVREMKNQLRQLRRGRSGNGT